jgi:hypothetical protein
VVRSILLVKFEQIEPPGAPFAERLADAEGGALAADVGGASTATSRSERGYNQVALVSKPLAKGPECRLER